MLFQFRKLVYTLILNFAFFLILMTAIQNSSNKTKVNFLVSETISLPISFIVGISFIGGSIAGSFLKIKSSKKDD
mgnify:FL=1